VLSVITVLPDHGVLFQLVSTFIGRRGVDTHIAHLVLGPLGEDPEIHTEDRAHELLDPAYDPRSCVYEHIHVLLEHLTRLGHEASIDVHDNAFRELERVQH
jgi:hypothetical protein